MRLQPIIVLTLGLIFFALFLALAEIDGANGMSIQPPGRITHG